MSLFSNAGNLLDLCLNNKREGESETLAKHADVSTGDFGKIASETL